MSRQPKEQNDLSLMFQGAKRTKLKVKMLSRKITRVFFFLNKMVQSPRKEANARTTVKYKSCRSIAQISVFHTSKSEFQYDISLKKCKIKNKNKRRKIEFTLCSFKLQPCEGKTNREEKKLRHEKDVRVELDKPKQIHE